jgi:hypothetical protein
MAISTFETLPKCEVKRASRNVRLDLFLRDTTVYQQALARYDLLRPILQGQSTLTQQNHATGSALPPARRRGRHARYANASARYPSAATASQRARKAGWPPL